LRRGGRQPKRPLWLPNSKCNPRGRTPSSPTRPAISPKRPLRDPQPSTPQGRGPTTSCWPSSAATSLRKKSRLGPVPAWRLALAVCSRPAAVWAEPLPVGGSPRGHRRAEPAEAWSTRTGPSAGCKKARKGRANVREPSVGIVDPRLTDHPSENV